MTIPSNITTELASLKQQVATASPLANATLSTLTAIQLNAANLVGDIQAAITAPNTLDTWSAPVDPISIVSGFLGVVVASIDQSTLSLMRGVVGRAAANLDQI